ncbi:MAG: hypothetical protein AAGH68_12660 [Pseudomonadota bacterium]
MNRLAPPLSLLAFAVLLRGAAASDPVVHVLVQLPLLAVAGWWGARALELKTPAPLTALIVAISATAFWMLPRSIDAALETPWVDLAKFISIPALIGASLAAAWGQLHPILRGFVKAQSLSMLGVLGFLYTHAPVRICNSYLVSDQERLGLGFLYLCAALVVLWTLPVLTGRPLSLPVISISQKKSVRLV